MATPESQTALPIGFYLEGGGIPPVSYDFYIRPEELTRQEPARLTVQQTLGGAWADDFGAGVATIRMDGHTGWRGTPTTDGMTLFSELRAAVYTGWFQRRKAAIQAGVDPGTVLLYCIDTLNSFCDVVAPRSFVLRRSRTDPLLLRYSIDLVVLGQVMPAAPDPIVLGMVDPLTWLLSVTGIGAAISAITGIIGSVTSAVLSVIGDVTSFINTAVGVFTSIVAQAQATVGVFVGAAQSLLSAGLSIAQAGMNAFNAFASVPGLVAGDIADLSAIAGGFSSIYCAIVNGFSSGDDYPDFSGLFGASNCSSTSGGDPISPFVLAGANPFESIFMPMPVPVLVSPEAVVGFGMLAADPLNLVGQNTLVQSNLAAIGSGVTLA